MRKIARKVGESIVVDGNTQITILKIQGARAWIGISNSPEHPASGDPDTPPSNPPLISGFLRTGER